MNLWLAIYLSIIGLIVAWQIFSLAWDCLFSVPLKPKKARPLLWLEIIAVIHIIVTLINIL